MKLKLLFLLLVFQSALGAKSGPEESYYVVNDLSKDWHVYDQKAEHYVPFILGISGSNSAHTVFFDAKKYKHSTLLLKSSVPNSYIFVNGLLYKNLIKDQWLLLDIADLSAYGENIAISFYGSSNPAYKEIFIGSKIDNTLQTSGIVRDNLLNMKMRTLLAHFDVYILILALILIFVTALSSINPKAFNEYFNLKDIFTVKIRDTRLLISKPLNQINITYVVLLSLISGFIYVLLRGKGVHLFQNQFPITESISGLAFAFIFLEAVLISLAGYFGKYFLLTIVGNLFGLEKSINIHYFKLIQFNLVFYLFVSIGLYTLILSHPPEEPNYVYLMLLAAVIVYISRTTIIYFTILKSTDIQSLYLFAYLCVVEILPIFIGIRFAF